MSNAADKALAAAGLQPTAGELVVQTEGVDLTPTVKAKRQLSSQMLKLEEGFPYILTFLAPIYEAEPDKPRVSRRRTGGTVAPMPKKYDQDPMLAAVTWHGPAGPEARTIIIYKVMEGELDKHFPNDGYVGRTLEVVRHQVQGKKYSTFELAEVVLEPIAAPEPAKRLRGPRK